MNKYFRDKTDQWVEFASKLIRCKPLSGNEKDCADIFLNEMKANEIECFRDEVGNPVGVIRGEEGGINVMITGHIDVVPAGNLEAWGEFEPYDGTVKDGKLYGRGISDMLGGLSAAFFAFLEIQKMVKRGTKIKGNIIFAGNVQEEPAESLGAIYLIEHTLPEHNLCVDVVYLAEPSNGNICLGHRGKVELVVDVHGKVAHSSTPKEGVSALEKALPFIEATYHELYETVTQHPAGNSSMAITDVELTPGKTYSCVPDLCTIRIDRRYVPPMNLDSVVNQVQRFIEGQMEKDPEFKAEVHIANNHRVCYTGYEKDMLKHHPFWSVDPENEYVKMSIQVLEKHGQKPIKDYWTFGTDGSAYCGIYQIPTIGYSCAEYHQAHQPKEHVVVDDMMECMEGYTAILCEIYDIDFNEIVK